jgi:uncharacterized membrane protein YfcA
MKSFWRIPLLLAAGLCAGFLNTVAGGGSLITLPLLIFLGLPPTTANGTNRIAIIVQNATGIIGFRHLEVSNFRYSTRLAIPALIGAIIGAKIAVKFNENLFKRVLAGVMIVVLCLIVFSPKPEAAHENLSITRQIVAMGVFFFIGIYGGFIQAGVGFIIMAALTVINGFDLALINAIKLFVVFFYTLTALGVFIKEKRVDWALGITLAIGNATGAWIGSQWAVAKGDEWIKIVLVVTVVAFAIRLVWQSFTAKTNTN